MTPRRRTRRALRATGLLIVVLGAGVTVSPYGTGWSYGVEAAPKVAASPSAAEPSRAGSRAGEGRERPGRRVPESAPEDADDTGAPEDEGGQEAGGDLTAVPEPPRATGGVPSGHPLRPAEQGQPAGRDDRSAEPGLKILPLGSGLILVGLGLGLAFVALRMRRGLS
ncbi:hypothetical protein [Streptomyces sp. SA15]|uniref:hypothetical protein n=1 Tax=Streptomyces sp. SA15 TaxID=934019 RepID=UPI00211B8D8E|nr:hypothetical protein [Streptomyces sp. SA15]